MTHLGRDYSSFQGLLSDADAEGIDFGYIKLTQGDTYINPDAAQQITMLKKHGVHVGYYHFFDPQVDVGGQLHHFITTAQAFGPVSLPLALDSEVDNEPWAQLAAQMMAFAIGVENFPSPVAHPRSLLYVNVSFYRSLQGFPWGRWVWLADPNPGAPHEPCLILQTAPRPVSSADTKVIDPDVFQGNEAQWAAFVGVAAPPVVTPPPASPTWKDTEVQAPVVIKFTTDANGNGWVESPFGGTPIVNAVAVNIDPAAVGTYTKTPDFKGVTANNKLVFENGAGNAEFAFYVWAAAE